MYLQGQYKTKTPNIYPTLIKSSLKVLVAVSIAGQAFPHSISSAKAASNRFLWHQFDVFRSQRSMLVSGMSSFFLEQLVRRWLATSENFCWHLWQLKAGTRSSSSATVTHCHMTFHKQKLVSSWSCLSNFILYTVIRFSMCCLSCSALKWTKLDCDWTKSTSRSKDMLTGWLESRNGPRVWACELVLCLQCDWWFSCSQ